MAAKKNKSSEKHKKTTVKKYRGHKALEKHEVQEAAPSEPQSPVVSMESTTPAEPANPLEASPKEQGSQPEPQSTDVPQPQAQPQSQPQERQPQSSQQDADTLVSQPLSAADTPAAEIATDKVEPEGNITQEPPDASGVVRDKEEQAGELQNIEEPKKKQLWIIIAIIIIALALIGGALWYFRENVLKRDSLKDKTTPVPSVLQNTPTPATDSAKIEIDFSEYSIQVLNGSGISGEAAKARDILSSEDFNIEEIGNADSASYEKTVIKAKKGVPSEFLDKLKGVLEESYILDSDEKLEESEGADVVIIIGSSKQQ